MPVVINERTLWETIWGKDSFGLLFLMLLCDYVVLTLVDSPQWGGLARGVPLALTVLFAVHTSAASPRLVRAWPRSRSSWRLSGASWRRPPGEKRRAGSPSCS